MQFRLRTMLTVVAFICVGFGLIEVIVSMSRYEWARELECAGKLHARRFESAPRGNDFLRSIVALRNDEYNQRIIGIAVSNREESGALKRHRQQFPYLEWISYPIPHGSCIEGDYPGLHVEKMTH